MSLKWYQRPRLVALDPATPVLDAARAIENNSIGAVVVQEKGQVVGIVTDRDLTIRVVGRGLDPKTTQLRDVMTTPVITLSLRDGQDDAIRVMQDRNVRRIPLVEQGRVVGMVTLDDLLLDETASLDQLAAIVQSQIGAGGPAVSPRSRGAMRSVARAEATYGRLINQLRTDADLDDVDKARTALEIVLKNVVRRLTPGEAKDLIAQLPSLLQPMLQALPPGPDKSITREKIWDELLQQIGVDEGHTAQILLAVAGVVARTISPGQIQDVQSQLPADLRLIFSAARLSA